MFNKMSYKNKFFGVVVALILLSIVSYKRVFKATYEIKIVLNELNQKLEMTKGSSNNIKLLSEKVDALDKLIGKAVEPKLVQHFLIDFVSKHSKITIEQIEETHQSIDDSFIIYTNQMVLQGNYNDLVKAVYAFEKEFETSKIVGVRFYTKKSYRKKQQQLFVKLIFQNYEKNI